MSYTGTVCDVNAPVASEYNFTAKSAPLFTAVVCIQIDPVGLGVDELVSNSGKSYDSPT